MSQIRVGILRGGEGEHYESSVSKGAELASHIFENLYPKYKPVDIFVDTNGEWHMGGKPILPDTLMHAVDVVWNTGESNFHHILESLSIPSVSVGSFTTAVRNSPQILKEHMSKIGVKVPRSIVLPVYQEDFDGDRNNFVLKKAKEVWQKFSPPWIVKPYSHYSDLGIRVAKTFEELVNAINEIIEHGQSILVEELIYGREARVHIVPGFRGEEMYTLPPVEIKDDVLRLGSFREEEKEKLINFAKEVCKHVGATHYIDSALVMTPKGQIYLKKISLTPDISDNSNLCQNCEFIGVKSNHIVEHMLKQALK